MDITTKPKFELNESIEETIRFSYTNQPDKESTDGHNKTSQLKPRSITKNNSNNKKEMKNMKYQMRSTC